jgi:hypothetical protein
MYHEAAKYFYDWMVIHGLDPFVVSALILLCFLYLRRKEISRFGTLEPGLRRELIMLITFTIGVIIIACVEVLGFLPKR